MHESRTQSSWFRGSTILFAGIPIFLSALTLIGWAFNIQILTNFNDSWVTMKPNTAVSLIFLGIALILLGRSPIGIRGQGIAAVFSSLVFLIGVMSLAQYATNTNWGIDEMLFKDVFSDIGRISKGRMAFISAFCFTFSGLSLLFLAVGNRFSRLIPDLLQLPVALASFFVLLGYFYGTETLQSLGLYGTMAINTAAAFFSISLGIITFHPFERIVSPLFVKTPAAAMFRWFLPISVTTSIVIGWLCYKGEEIGILGQGLGEAIFTVTIVTSLIIKNLIGATALERANQRSLKIEKEARKNDQLLRSLLDYSPVAVFLKDLDGKFLFINRYLLEKHRIKPESMIGKTVFDLHPRIEAEEYQANDLKVLNTDKAIEFEESATIAGEHIMFLSSKFPVHDDDGETIAIGGVSTDITDRKLAEDNIKFLNTRLALQNAQLNAVNQELEAFSYSVSHDLRAPLRSIDGFSQALLEDYGGKLDATADDYLRRVRAAAIRMGQLIDDLLGLSRVVRADVRPETIDLTGLARSIVEELRERSPERAVEIRIEENLTTEGDPHLLRIILTNLLSNAWKYTSKRKGAQVEFGLDPNDSGQVFYVRDNGAGFDPTYAHKLFKAFQRLHSPEEFDGTGIGLALVQRIVNKHGGNVWAQGEVGRGATFYFSMKPFDKTGGYDERQGNFVSGGQPGRRAVDQTGVEAK